MLSRSAAGSGTGADVAHGSFPPNLFTDPHVMDHDDQDPYHQHDCAVHDQVVDNEQHDHAYDAHADHADHPADTHIHTHINAHALAHDSDDDDDKSHDHYYDLTTSSKPHSHLIHPSIYTQQQPPPTPPHHHHHPTLLLPTPSSQSQHHSSLSIHLPCNAEPIPHGIDDNNDTPDKIYADENEDVDMQEGGAPLASSSTPFDAVADAIATMDDDAAVSYQDPHQDPWHDLTAQQQIQQLDQEVHEMNQQVQQMYQQHQQQQQQEQSFLLFQQQQQQQQQNAVIFGTAVPLPSQIIPNAASAQLHALQHELHMIPGDGLEDQLSSIHPMTQFMVHPNPMSLSPDNFGLVEFLRHWALKPHPDPTRDFGSAVPSGIQILDLADKLPNQDKVDYEQLQGDQCDLQGVNWTNLGEHVTRRHARAQRRAIYVNYVNMQGSDKWNLGFSEREIPNVDNYFRHRRTNLRRDVRLLHFQLRNILGVASRTRVFYPSYGTVCEFNPATNGRSKKAMKFDDPVDAQVSTLTVGEDVLMVGGFLGDYRYRYLDSESLEPSEGKLTNFTSGITNHVQVHTSRQSSAPVAAFASNDNGFRLVDLTTNRLLSETMYNEPVNCTALSPDGRLRAMVGDHQNLYITDADSGHILQSLGGHRDFGFACDWAPNGWTVATGNQDRSIRVWDARKWRNSNGESAPLSIVRTEMSGARSLHFSPLGSGKRVLVAAEEADYINIIDAQTFETKQTFDIFGEIGGTSFTNAGQDLFVLSCDRFRGGLLQLERCDGGAEDTYEYSTWPTRFGDEGYDWLPSTDHVVRSPDSQETMTQRRRKAYQTIGNLEPF